MDQNLEKLKYFLGKVCTILTSPTSRSFDDMAHANCFVGIVEEIDELGIWIRQPNSDKMSFFSAPLGIIEESYRLMTEEEASLITAEMEKKTEAPVSELQTLKHSWQTFKEAA